MPLNDDQIYYTFGAPSSPGRIAPFVSRLVNKDEDRRVISYGLSSVGYDLRICPQGVLLARPEQQVDPMDVKAIGDPPLYYKTWDAEVYDQPSSSPLRRFKIPGNSVLISSSVEYISMPKDIFALAVGKSTYARAGIHVLVTPLEPGWRGRLTIEVANLNSFPAYVYADEGICQLVFFRLDEKPKVTYDDRAGKYQDQDQPTLPRI